MKKIIITLGLWLLATGLWAQNDTGAKVVPVSQAIQNNGYTMQVGVPYLVDTEQSSTIVDVSNPNINDDIYPFDIRFPWDALYLFPTFAEESFDVSKGYFGDKILINWTLRANNELVTNIRILRQEYVDGILDDENYVQIGNVSKFDTEFEDKYVEGGVLYAYKIVADGVSEIESEFSTFITGIGFRSPTAIVTGNVSYKGGNPVEDVTIKATSEGSTINLGSALRIPSAGKLDFGKLSKPIDTAATLQVWMRPESAYSGDAGPNIRLFQLKEIEGATTINVEVNLLEASNILKVNIGTAEYRIQNFYPSGVIDERGDDVLVPVTDFNNNYVHFSVVLSDGNVPLLYINGRGMTVAYQTEVNQKIVEYDTDYDGVFEDYPGTLVAITIPTAVNVLALTPTTSWNNLNIGSGKDILVDEIRIWNKAKEPANIRTNFRRYINGNNVNLISYLSANEGVGDFAYDLSRSGFNYNKNNGKLISAIAANNVTWVAGSGNIPSASQLGILGVTDEFGNYEITAIPYSGTGESFNITPLFGLHQFEPGQQLVFLGQGAEVVNKIDFVDISSFSFKGKVFFDTRGVFKSFVELDGAGIEGDTQISGPGILDEGYNYYQKGSEKFYKGAYWYNEVEDRLERYATVFAEGVNVYVDGTPQLDENNVPLVTDENGEFEVSVPIGKHFITLKKDGHIFSYDGRFPKKPAIDAIDDDGLYEFFEDSNEPVIFIDSTRVTVVGRVVGGGVQAQKVIGFGEEGLFEKTIEDAEGDSKTITVSSKNNIGVADITLGYDPPGDGNVTEYTKYNFETNSETGEFRESLLPLDYELLAADIRIPSSTDPIENTISILKAGTKEDFPLSTVGELTTPEFIFEDGTEAFGEPYHHVIGGLNYRVDPVLKVLEQTSDATIQIGEEIFNTDDFSYPVFTQFREYKIQLNSFERYVNYDDGGEVEDIVPIVDGELLITNNLELPGSKILERDPNDLSIINYTFRAGQISISRPFTKSINIKYKDPKGNEKEADIDSYSPKGIILGGQADDEQTFVTAAPDIPDIILRDPPGSNSFASIESGESFSFTTSSSITDTSGTDSEVTLSLGVDFELGGGLAGPVVETNVTADASVGISTSTSSSDGESITKTYSFSQTISTSDDPSYVGSKGDLYIGQSKNYFYGSFDKVKPSKTIPTKNVDGSLVPMPDSEYLVLGTGENQLYISKQKSVFFLEEPAETFFIYSQKQIIDALIPELQLLSTQAVTQAEKENDPAIKDKPEILTQEQYTEQVSLWRKMILENERSKYLVKNDRANVKESLVTIVSAFKSKLEEALQSDNTDDRLQGILNDKKIVTDKIQTLLNNNFDDNISFDAGVGEFTRSIETSLVAAKSTEFNLFLNSSVSGEIGFAFNGVGGSVGISGFTDKDLNSALSEEEQSTVTISYTLKDNDRANLLSVDVVNLFDGNGPIFSVLGGRTSCPYEGPELSNFYNNALYDPSAETISTLPEGLREQLSFATQRVEVPLLSVEVAEIGNVLEGRNAEFELILENNSVSGTDAVFLLKVDNLTNPYNALINIEPNGTLVNVPYGEKVYYTLTLAKSVSDVYDYIGSNDGEGLPLDDGIRIVLQSLCDGESVSDDVRIKAHFLPTCSEVVLSAPLDNWVYNRDAAYNLDGSTNPLTINMIGFNTSFASFEKIDLEYRLATSPNWTRLQTYYGSQEFKDEADANSETNIALISSATLFYSLDIAALKLQDGYYEIRARSSCTNDTEFISDVITGRVDLNSPQKFGTPLPIDGILGVGEDLRVGFNENIFYNSAVSSIEIKGQTNQLPINNSVSLYFEGATNTAVINNPKITSGDLTLEFWMNNSTIAGAADIIKQDGGLNIGLNNGELFFTLGGVTAQGGIASDGLFHHYTFTHKNSTGEISIYQDDAEIAGETGNANIDFTNNNPLVIGGNTFIGNMHDLRLWNKTISLENAYAKMYDKLIGNEASLIGYWPMDEGRGELAKDLARFKHAQVNADWDIKPKGKSYDFNNGQFLELDNVGFVQLTKEMDATISFWLKTGATQEATLFSNGKGDGSDVVQSNGLTNKWAINISNSGMLSLESEGNSYMLTSQPINDDTWHHVTLLFNRIGSLRTYVDAEPVTSNQMAAIGGFSGNKIWLGARGAKDLAGTEAVDRTFTGKLDEFRLWNTLRNVEQISRDRFNEMDFESIGLLLYARMNAPDVQTGKGPRYYHAYSNQNVIPSDAVLSSGEVNYSDDVPAIKPERNLIKFLVNHVINEDEMILEPVVTDWASLEGQILDITVHRMFDDANNMQQSPITWTAYVKRNEVSWFVEGYNEIVDIVKDSGEEQSFEITLINKGGNGQPYTINNVPSWLKLSSSSGTLEPDSRVIITATIDKEITPGDYLENLYLQTDFGYDEKLTIQIKVLAEEPDWEVDPTDFDYSMNIVGRIKVDSKFSEDSYDKIAAFYNGEARGVVNLIYLESFQEYYAYLTVYSNNVFGEELEFSIWDASQGKILVASIDSNSTITFKENEVMGTLTNPVIFENSDVLVQDIELNKGWTWVSLNVNDSKFTDLNALTQGMNLDTDDRILSHSPAQLETYYKDESNSGNSTWSGTVSANGGLSTSKMYKVNFDFEQSLDVKGIPIDISTWSFPIKANWNWLPYPLLGNQSTNEALAYFDAVDGDVIKSQNLFAIYDPINGWNGTLNYLVSGNGYMIKSSKDQTFSYPNYLGKPISGKSSEIVINEKQDKIADEFTKYAENMNAIVQLPEGYNELFVYDSAGVLKGKATNQIVNDAELSFITIYGDTPETLVFYIGDGRAKKVTVKTFNFKSNNVLGTVSKPIILEDFSNTISVFPNPFENDLTIKVDAVEGQVVTIQLYNLMSQLLFTKKFEVTEGVNLLKFSPKVATGTYLLQVKMKESTVISKIIKN
ncbi:LamG-like jellyroll fold domain-containing protein [Lutibacter flavus]|uniref:Por secretion system C-terminal sorting domain-containing protein n=1 Tax=Lutibacter flavus TaxID=691689 RepID=A0A238YKV5_9FLAO|nr:LamG-like jellyroll fold domain-containing protein [Lutibacter flavus]SNR71632.1 Por secretion system C-terminal sorting domain-containing protein [Lutibacter flavus]